MQTAKELEEKYQNDLKELKKNCKHEDSSGWMPEYWAPGHGTGREVRICNICWEVVESKDQYNYEIIINKDAP